MRKTRLGRAIKAGVSSYKQEKAASKKATNKKDASSPASKNLSAKEKADFKASYDKVPMGGGKKLSSFGEAFKEASKSGKSVFTYNGKKYAVEFKEKPKEATKKKPAKITISAKDSSPTQSWMKKAKA